MMLIPYFETSPSRSLFSSVTDLDCFLPTFFAVFAPSVDVGVAADSVDELSIFLLTLAVVSFLFGLPSLPSSLRKFSSDYIVLERESLFFLLAPYT